MKAKAKPLLVILSGAGISAESGLKTFRASDGLWENHKIEEVATPEGFKKNPNLVLEFYNQRRKAVIEAKPNLGHIYCKRLESIFRVVVITQNIDNLHEKAGSTEIIHLHGEILKAQSTGPYAQVIDWPNKELNVGDCDANGYQYRPQVVWFGEAVPKMEEAMALTQVADAMIIVGTSLNVYPAAGLWSSLKKEAPLLLVDPELPKAINRPYHHIKEQASVGMPASYAFLKSEFGI